MEQDFAPILETKIPENIALAKTGKIDEAIENLLAVEKQTRQAEDSRSTSKLATAIVKICWESKKFDYLNEKIVLLAKRRGQLKMVIRDIVQEAMTYLDKIDDKNARIALIDTLRTITEGKIFVENERARLTRTLAKIKEDEGKISDAARVLQELQVETFGSMEKNEKIDFLLEQVRLTLTNKDYIRAQIISNKINRRVLTEPDFQELKLRFYTLMIQYYMHEKNYLEVCKCFQAMYDTPSVKADKARWIPELRRIVLFAILSPHNNEQNDLLHRVYEDKNLLEVPKYRDLLKRFITIELIRWERLNALYKEEFASHPDFFPSSGAGTGTGSGLWPELHKRVVEHNVRVISTYYTRVTMVRLSELLELKQEEAEKFVSDLVSKKSIFAKIDRPKGIVVFRKTQDPSETLNNWSENVTSLLDLLEKTTHLIHREIMVHNVKV
jgi:26S proteasome regulatory subunit N5